MKSRISDISALLVCAALSSAAGSMVLKTFSLELPLVYIILLPLAFVIAIYLVLINKKIGTIAFLSAIIILAVIYLRLSPENKLLVSDFFSKSLGFIKNGSELSELYAKILGSSMMFVISLVFILPAVIFPFSPAVFAICITFILAQWESHSGKMLYESLIMLASTGIFFARTLRVNESDNAKYVRNISSLWLIPALIAAVMSVSSIAGNYSLDAKWEWLEVRTNIIGDYFSELSGKTSPRSVFDISSVGYQPLRNRLGGPVELDDTKLLQVRSTANYSMLLRGNIKNTYTGSGWIDDSVSYRYRMIGKFSKEQAEVFNLNAPPQDEKVNLYFDKAELEITPLQNSSATIFASYRTLDVKPEKMLTMLVSFNTEGEVFSSRDIQKGISYTVELELIKQNSNNFASYIQALQSELGEDELQYSELILLNYTQPFEALPPSVTSLALSITDGIENDYLKALAIKSYLEQEGFYYTLTPDIPPEDQDFVKHFLETKRGYCTYYATAMTVLARSAGLPSRYVEGFKSDGKERDFILTGENAHAWAEIYIKGVGWLPFDPVTSEEVSDSEATAVDTTPDEYFGEETSQTEPDILLPEDRAKSGINPLILLTYILFGILSAAAVIFTAEKARTSMRYAKRKYKNTSEIAIFHFKEIMGLMSYLKYEKPIGHTLEEYSKGADKRIVIPGKTFKDVSDIISTFIYAERDLTYESMKKVYEYYKALLLYTRQSLGIPRYFIINISTLIKALFHKSARYF